MTPKLGRQSTRAVSSVVYHTNMRSERYPSLFLVFDELKALLDRQISHVDALDSKASIVIGFTAVALGITVGRPNEPVGPFVLAGVGLGALAFTAALRAFWVRPFKALPRPREFYAEFASAEEEQSRIVLCNLAVLAFEENARNVTSKARALKFALMLLAGSVIALVLGFFLEGVIA